MFVLDKNKIYSFKNASKETLKKLQKFNGASFDYVQFFIENHINSYVFDVMHDDWVLSDGTFDSAINIEDALT